MADENLIWTECDRREVYKTPVFTVTERDSKGPDGQKGTFIVNEANDWVVVIPEHNDSFLMVKQWRHGEKALSIEFPGGVIEKGEDPAIAAARELKEETGAEAGSLIHLGSLNPNPALFSNHVHIYLARDLTFSNKQELDKDEFVSYREVTKEEVFKNLASPLYQHALMTAAAGLYLIYTKTE
ncbi:NUDIX hydrolase [Treponema sp.]|uniref:NUDIX hydrolase n=1 Tax=Treponema sp. TaxID=166 RepID=UPI0025F11120|nr:NUDIX hydrolase [Treponema sp.]MCR5218943.1 NUDIX hydrolase [Treponema sp.]